MLLVDDDPVGRKLAARLLEKLGYCADLAADGAEALARLRERSYPLVFLDLHMPVLSGEETAQRIRQEWGEAGPALIALTGSTGDELSGDGRALFDGWLLKPLRLADLQPVLERWL